MSIPILGQLVEAFECVAFVTARCKCEPENHPMVIGVGAVAVCERCRKAYAVTGVTYDASKHQMPIAAISHIGTARPRAETDDAQDIPRVQGTIQ